MDSKAGRQFDGPLILRSNTRGGLRVGALDGGPHWHLAREAAHNRVDGSERRPTIGWTGAKEV